MKFLIAFFLLGLAQGQTFSFQNGDSLIGKIKGISEGNVKLESENLGVLVEVPVTKLDSLKIPFKLQDVAFGDEQSQVVLFKGDTCTGVIREISDESVIVDTEWGGGVSINREFVRHIKPRILKKNLLGDLTDLSDWGTINGRQKWTVTEDGVTKKVNGVMMCKKVGGTNQLHFSTKYKSSSSPRFRVHLFASEGEVVQANNYFGLEIQRGQVVTIVKINGNNESLGQRQSIKSWDLGDFQQLDLYCDIEAQDAVLYVNGEKVAHWVLPEDMEPHPWVRFFGDYEGEITLKDTRLEKWNGVLPIERETLDIVGSKDTSFIYLKNGDVMDVKTVNYANNHLIAETKLGEIKVPLKNIAEVDFLGQEYSEAKREIGDVQITFKNRDQVTLRLDSWIGTKLQGTSQYYGEVTIDANKVAEVKFDLYR